MTNTRVHNRPGLYLKVLCVSYKNRCSTTWVTQRPHAAVCVSKTTVNANCVSAKFLLQSEWVFIPQVPSHDFTVRVSGFRLENISAEHANHHAVG